MAKRKESRKIRRTTENLADKIARRIMPAAQVAKGGYEIRDVANWDDDDQRHMVRSGEKKTVRKLTKIEKLHRAGVIGQQEAAACEWYSQAHSLRYDTTGITANYGFSCGARRTNFDHLPKSAEQEIAYRNFEFARSAISPMFLPMFERVVLHGRPLGKLSITFRTAARQLLCRLEGVLAL